MESPPGTLKNPINGASSNFDIELSFLGSHGASFELFVFMIDPGILSLVRFCQWVISPLC